MLFITTIYRRRWLLMISLFFCNMSIFAVEYSLDSLLTVLDKTLEQRPFYNQRKIEFINSIKQELLQTTDGQQLFNCYGKLFSQYSGFQMDSAFRIAEERMRLSLTLSRSDAITAQLNYAEAMMVTGLYKESIDFIQTLDIHLFDKRQKEYYFHLSHSLFILISEFTLSTKAKEYYRQLEYQYKDSILSVIDPESIGFYLVRSTQLLHKGQDQEAKSLAECAYSLFNQEGREIALTAYTLSDVYRHLGDREQEKIYLTISSIEDIKEAVKEYISLRKLAAILYEEGDIKRAYAYMRCSLEDALYCNARFRMLEVSQMIPIINANYDLKMRKEKERLIYSLVVISFLSIVLLAALLYIYKQLKVVAGIRRSLKQTNSDLQKVNEQLNQLNSELSESNLVKEEYIGYVFTICSAYIDRLEGLRKKVNRKIQAGQIDDLFKYTNASSFMHDELKAFYRYFDTIFLHLFPNFVADFNSLLNDEEQTLPREGELLSPELRIYALVRLGIGDSVKIAAFLRYSPQTVYNYRLKVRNKSKILKNDFPEAVRQIGRIQE